jgi:hypothetical protein
MMQRAGILSVVLLSMALSSFAQKVRLQEPPRTRLEEMAAEVGVLVVKGSTKVGEVGGFKGGSIAVEAREVYVVASGNRASGLTIEIKSPADGTSEHVAYVDCEDIAPLLAAIDYFSKVTHSCTALDDYQVVFRTAGGLELSVKSIRSGEGVGISCVDTLGIQYTVFLSPADLPALKDLLLTAQGKIDGREK